MHVSYGFIFGIVQQQHIVRLKKKQNDKHFRLVLLRMEIINGDKFKDSWLITSKSLCMWNQISSIMSLFVKTEVGNRGSSFSWKLEVYPNSTIEVLFKSNWEYSSKDFINRQCSFFFTTKTLNYKEVFMPCLYHMRISIILIYARKAIYITQS